MLLEADDLLHAMSASAGSTTSEELEVVVTGSSLVGFVSTLLRSLLARVDDVTVWWSSQSDSVRSTTTVARPERSARFLDGLK